MFLKTTARTTPPYFQSGTFYLELTVEEVICRKSCSAFRHLRRIGENEIHDDDDTDGGDHCRCCRREEIACGRKLQICQQSRLRSVQDNRALRQRPLVHG